MTSHDLYAATHDILAKWNLAGKDILADQIVDLAEQYHAQASADERERALARDIVLEMVAGSAMLPPEKREDHANLWLQRRMIQELFDYSDRLKAAIQSTMEAAMEGIKKVEATP